METPQLHRYLGMPAAPPPVAAPHARPAPMLAEFPIPLAPPARKAPRPARRWLAWRRDWA